MSIRHDTPNYGSGFIAGRGNLTSITRWNVEYPATSGEAVTSSMKYNTAGAYQPDEVVRLRALADGQDQTARSALYALNR